MGNLEGIDVAVMGGGIAGLWEGKKSKLRDQ